MLQIPARAQTRTTLSRTSALTIRPPHLPRINTCKKVTLISRGLVKISQRKKILVLLDKTVLPLACSYTALNVVWHSSFVFKLTFLTRRFLTVDFSFSSCLAANFQSDQSLVIRSLIHWYLLWFIFLNNSPRSSLAFSYEDKIDVHVIYGGLEKISALWNEGPFAQAIFFAQLAAIFVALWAATSKLRV